MRRILHVAATIPNSAQGTPAAVRAMVDATGPSSRFVSYRPSTREEPSGPSWRRLLRDVRLLKDLRLACSERAPDLIVAHHVEATAACLAANARPTVFLAHTSLKTELESYFPPRLAPTLRGIGTHTDRWLGRRVSAVAAVSPWLCDSLANTMDHDVTYVPIPWPRAAESAMPERIGAREALGIAPDAAVVLYTGNLDRYQGWEEWLEACVRVARKTESLRILVGTSSPTADFLGACKRARVEDRVMLASLQSEADRRRVHAAATIAVVGRRHAGGVPIKLLEAFARGVPAVVTARAVSGLPITETHAVIVDDHAGAIAAGLELGLANSEHRRALARAALDYLRHHHGPERTCEALMGCLYTSAARDTASTSRGAVQRSRNSSSVSHA